MKPKNHSPLWPYLGILACLFVLSVTAPRAWDRMARRHASFQVSTYESPAERTSSAFTVNSGQIASLPIVESDQTTPQESIASEFDPTKLFFNQQFGTGEPEPIVEPARSQASQSPVLPEAPEEPAAQTAQEQASSAAAPTEVESAPEVPHATASDVADTSDATEGAMEGRWPLPRVLIAQLTRVAQDDSSAHWATEALGLINALCQPDAARARPLGEILHDLHDLVERDPIAGLSTTNAQEIRTRYALARWVDVWEHAAALDAADVEEISADEQAAHVLRAVTDVERMTRTRQGGANWKNYLRLDDLGRLASSVQSNVERRRVARLVLDRLADSQLTQAQRKLADDPAIARLQKTLAVWAAEDVASDRLLRDLEQYERSSLPSDARQVANDIRSLGWSESGEAQKLSQVLETHYLNANLRAVVNSKLANRMMPQPASMESAVQDVVVRVPVYGMSRTFTKLNVRFVPDDQRIRIGLEANGLVDSDTMSTSGPATFYNEGRSTFLVRKLMVLGPRGLAVWPAVAEADNNYSYLVSLETDFDGMPLVGALVRNIARSQHEGVQDEARSEVEQKVAARARRQLDAEVRPRLVKAAQRIQDEQLATIKRLGLQLVPVGLATTEDRAVARVRLAGVEQLGAHTPRPRAPADSWFSMQVHQSTLNNVLEKLDLNGREFALPDLFRWIAEKFDNPKLANLDELPDDVHLRFAKQDAVRLRCEDGRVEVVLSFAELTSRGSRWRNFTVRTYYRPEAENLDPRFVRDTTIHFDGKSVKGKSVPVLRSIFSKVLSRNRELRMLSETVTSDARLKGLQIAQFVVEDGWIGLAYSPRRAASNVARRPK